MRNKASLPKRDGAPALRVAARRKGRRTVVTIGDKLIVLSHPNLSVPHFTQYVKVLRDNEQRVTQQ